MLSVKNTFIKITNTRGHLHRNQHLCSNLALDGDIGHLFCRTLVSVNNDKKMTTIRKKILFFGGQPFDCLYPRQVAPDASTVSLHGMCLSWGQWWSLPYFSSHCIEASFFLSNIWYFGLLKTRDCSYGIRVFFRCSSYLRKKKNHPWHLETGLPQLALVRWPGTQGRGMFVYWT